MHIYTPVFKNIQLEKYIYIYSYLLFSRCEDNAIFQVVMFLKTGVYFIKNLTTIKKNQERTGKMRKEI